MSEIAQLERKIRMLERKIRIATNYVTNVEIEAEKWLSQKGVPRGNWGYARGAYEVSTNIRGILE